jgi:hypothetical protein
VIREDENGVIIQVGYCVDQDCPIEVMKVPKLMMDLMEIERISITINALHQLRFSNYFPSYLGFNLNADTDYALYFFTFYKSLSLINFVLQLQIHYELFFWILR